MKRIALFLLFLLAFRDSQGVIYEIPHFKDLLSHSDSNTFVVLDIDDTLLIPVQTVGTDVWFRYRIGQLEKEGYEPSLAFRRALTEWEGIRHLTKVKKVEEDADLIVHQLQNQGIKIIGLSTQAHALASCTLNQLESLGFNLAKTAPATEDLYFMNGLGVLFRKGVLFTAGTDKGKALLIFFQKCNYKPVKVTFINDKFQHLKDVENVLEAEGIAFVGLRYNFCDERINTFDPKIADFQLAPLLDILSDEEAMKRLNNLQNTISESPAAN